VLATRYGEEAGRLGAKVVLIGGGRWLGLRTALVRMGKVGLHRGYRKRWVMGMILSFGMIGGYKVILFVNVLVGCMI